MGALTNIFIVVAIIAILVISYIGMNNTKEVSEEITETNTEEEIQNAYSVFSEPVYEIESRDLVYYSGAKGYLAKPKDGKHPGIIMIHEWLGLNEHIKAMADKLAGQGYTVLAIDLYNGEVTTNSSRARELSSSVRGNQYEAIKNMKAAVKYLREEEKVENLATLGWCFGGGESLVMALNDQSLDATVIYYGTLVTDKQNLSKINNPVLGIFGANDSSIPVSSVNTFDDTLDELNVENEIYIYDGVGHAFANPSGMNYAKEETQDAWDKTLDFLERHLK